MGTERAGDGAVTPSAIRRRLAQRVAHDEHANRDLKLGVEVPKIATVGERTSPPRFILNFACPRRRPLDFVGVGDEAACPRGRPHLHLSRWLRPIRAAPRVARQGRCCAGGGRAVAPVAVVGVASASSPGWTPLDPPTPWRKASPHGGTGVGAMRAQANHSQHVTAIARKPYLRS